MKRCVKTAFPLLLFAVTLLTALFVFILTANAEDATEATLVEATINYGTDSSKDSYGYEVGTTVVNTYTGSFAELADKLASLAPAADTRYVLTLNKDIAVDTEFAIAGNEHAEVWINLGGHKITSTVNGPMFTAAGSGAVIRVFGEFNSDGSYGSFETSTANGAFVKIEAGSTDRVDVKYLDATFSGNAEGTSLFIAEGGKLIIQHSTVTLASSNAVSIVNAENSAVDLKYSDFFGNSSATLVSASASKVYIEGGEMKGDCLINSDETASSIVMTGMRCEVGTAFVQGSADTTTYILGSTMKISTAIATGEANADNLIFYYGDGTTSIIGQDPSGYGLGSADCSYAVSGSTYTMTCSSTEVALATVVTVGSAPETGYYSTPKAALQANLAGIGTDMSAVSDSTLRIVTLINDYYSSDKAGVTSISYSKLGCEDASVIFDLNGHTLTNAYTSSTSNIFSVSHNMHFTLDGLDAAGNVGTYNTAARYERLIYARQTSNQGQTSYHLVNTIKNLNYVATNFYQAEKAFPLSAACGHMFVENVNMKYTGEPTADLTGNELTIVSIAGASTVAHIDGLNVISSSELDLSVKAMSTSEGCRLFINNYKTTGVETVLESGDGCDVLLENSVISSDDAIFSGAGSIRVYDCEITTATGVIASGNAIPTFYYGTGKTVVYTNGNIMSGNTAAEEGYAMGPVSGGIYKLISADGVHTLTMPVVFSDGMMLQRGKQVNIYGYCQDIGDTVRVTIGNQTAEALVDADGKWVASFAPMNAARGVTISIKQLGKGDDAFPDIAYENVNIGEIWVVSGQSNAEMDAGLLEDVNEYALLSEALGIRAFTSEGYSATPDAYGNGEWKDVTASLVKSTEDYAISAVGYATVARLAAELGSDVPVGLITIAKGSSVISTWMDYNHLAELSPFLAQHYLSEIADGVLPTRAYGTNAVPTVLYNQQVYPLEGFTTAGVLWYQGCGDVPGRAYDAEYIGQEQIPYLGPEGTTYSEYFAALQKIFRRAFDNGGDDLPFYVMQLAPYASRVDYVGAPEDGSYLTTFKYEQYDFCKNLDNTYLVPLATEGMAFTSQDKEAGQFLHPARKSPVGIRTADMILANEYGIKYTDVVSYPQPISAVRNADGTVTITFNTELKLLYGVAPEGFELTADGTTWTKATGIIDGKKLILSGVSGATGVRYGSGRTQVELADGTIIEVALKSNQSKLSEDGLYYTVKDSLTGKSYVVEIDGTDAVRTKQHGNITNTSGIPLVLFSMDVVEE